VAVIHNGVEWNDYEVHFQQKRASLRGLSSPPRLLFIGHEWERKGLKRLLHALSFIRGEPFHLTAVGRERHPERFERCAAQLQLLSRVTFVPTAQSPLSYYREANIAVIPSLYDPFANVTLEALAMGLFVITTTANGGSEAISSGVNGIVLDENASNEDLARAIASALCRVKDPALPVAIRNSVSDFDFSKKLKEFVTLVEADAELSCPFQDTMTHVAE
jgi:UDP-glucose:(heptosyl)LPS alpha-1,3-glucosyltransferase